MKTVLIPTDFSLVSLNIVKQAAAYFSDERVRVVLFHALHAPTDIQDLLSINSRVPHEKITEEFRHTCAAIKRKSNDAIAHISFQYLYGNTTAVFKNFIEANSIDCIFFPSHIVLQNAYANSVDMGSLFRHASIPFITSISSATSSKTFSSLASDKKLAFAAS